MELILILTVLLVAITIGVGVYAIKTEMSGKTAKKILGVNLSTFFALLVGATIFLLSGGGASASGTEDLVVQATTGDGLKYIGAALSTGMAAIGTGIAVAATGAAAIGAISEDPKLLGRTVIFVGLSEGIAIYGLIISIMILG